MKNEKPLLFPEVCAVPSAHNPKTLRNFDASENFAVCVYKLSFSRIAGRCTLLSKLHELKKAVSPDRRTDSFKAGNRIPLDGRVSP